MNLQTTKTVGSNEISLKMDHASCGIPYNYKNQITLTAHGKTKKEAVNEMLGCIEDAYEVLNQAQAEIENL